MKEICVIFEILILCFTFADFMYITKCEEVFIYKKGSAYKKKFIDV